MYRAGDGGMFRAYVNLHSFGSFAVAGIEDFDVAADGVAVLRKVQFAIAECRVAEAITECILGFDAAGVEMMVADHYSILVIDRIEVLCRQFVRWRIGQFFRPGKRHASRGVDRSVKDVRYGRTAFHAGIPGFDDGRGAVCPAAQFHRRAVDQDDSHAGIDRRKVRDQTLLVLRKVHRHAVAAFGVEAVILASDEDYGVSGFCCGIEPGQFFGRYRRFGEFPFEAYRSVAFAGLRVVDAEEIGNIFLKLDRCDDGAFALAVVVGYDRRRSVTPFGEDGAPAADG